MKIVPAVATLILMYAAIAGAQSSSEILVRGAYLVRAAGCADCHSLSFDRPFAGGIRLDTTLGPGMQLTFYTPNITPDKTTGIGDWTVADFIRAIRKGTSPKGSYFYPVFPWRSYTKITDDDARAIYAYLRTLAPVVNFTPKSDVGFPIFNQRWLMWFWKNLFMRQSSDPIYNLRNGPGPFEKIDSKSDSWNRGAYLVEALFHCAECHSPRNIAGGMIVDQWMAGSSIPVKGLYPPNITPDLATGLGNWRRDDWLRFLAAGVLPNGGEVGGDMASVIQNSAALSESDRASMADYLMTLDPVVRKNEGLQ